MAENTGISWTDSTFNPWIGCTRVSPACDHCYAATLQKRVGGPEWGPGEPRHRTNLANWNGPVRWNKHPFSECVTCGWRGETRKAIEVPPPAGFEGQEAARACPSCRSIALKATRRRVFCASLADVFDNEVPGHWREDLFALIARTPNLDWLLLTKRIGNVERMVEKALYHWPSAQARLQVDGQVKPPTAPLPPWPWANVWIGASVVNQAEADRDVPKLLATPAAVRFLSMEPLLGPVTLTELQPPGADRMWIDAIGGRMRSQVDHDAPETTCAYIDWVIVGGESGTDARPMHPDWVRDLREQCFAQRPMLFKQWGEWLPAGQSVSPAADARPQRELVGTARHVFDDGTVSVRLGKRHTGALLDGRAHHAFPGA